MNTLSIVVPAYNESATIDIILNVLINVSLPDGLEREIVIVNDFSTDDTSAKIQEFIKNNPQSKFQFFSQPKNMGKGAALHKGIEMAKGEWLYFMGSDDSFYNSEILEKIFALEAVNTHDVIYGNVFSSRFEHPYDGKFSYYKLAIKNICHQSIFFRKNVFTKVGKFNLDYKIWADWDHNIRWFYSSRIKKYYINEIIANYADGGFSSLNEDSVFIKEKNYKLLKEGFSKLPPAQRRDVCNLALVRAEKDGDFLRASVLKVVKFALKIDKFLAQKIK